MELGSTQVENATKLFCIIHPNGASGTQLDAQ